jgi:hypothetical protein
MVLTVAAWRMTKAVEGEWPVSTSQRAASRKGCRERHGQWELRKTLLLREALRIRRRLEPESFRIELRARSDYGTPTDPQV